MTLRNRIIMSPLTRSRADTNVPSLLSVEYYRQRAEGGAGLIVTEGVCISQQGTEWPYAPGIWSKSQVAAWKKITAAVHSKGGHIFAQLMHVGRLAHPDAPEQKASGQPVYGPSPIAARGGKFRFIPGVPGYVQPTEIPDPSAFIVLYKQAGINARAAGFDGVEVHCGNGFLIHQFLDFTSNLRKDSWGGSVENRARFGLEVLKALVDVFGRNRVSIKLTTVGGYNDMGMPFEDTIDTFGYFITEAEKLNLAYITLLRYLPALELSFDDKPRGTKHDVLATFRPFIKRTPLFLNGSLTPTEASALIKSGQIDAAVFGWLWIGHPDLAKRIAKGKPLDAEVNIKALYGPGPNAPLEEHKKGYTDYPAAKDEDLEGWLPFGLQWLVPRKFANSFRALLLNT